MDKLRQSANVIRRSARHKSSERPALRYAQHVDVTVALAIALGPSLRTRGPGPFHEQRLGRLARLERIRSSETFR